MPDQKEAKPGAAVLRVAVPLPLRRSFDYLPPANANLTGLRPACRIEAPFGRRKLIGFLLEAAADSRVGRDQLKAATALIDSRPLFSPAVFELLRWSADYYHHPIGEVLAAALPPPLRRGEPLYRETETWSATTGPESLSGRARRQRQCSNSSSTGKALSGADLDEAGRAADTPAEQEDGDAARRRRQRNCACCAN